MVTNSAACVFASMLLSPVMAIVLGVRNLSRQCLIGLAH
ncbi:unnamed protein product [Rodentolepis nana]|uniref:Uncharacterized protein n=1 Tax=Rodentolepis nana TaxID=102285 RepID=A0A3P7SGW0_RODNA|nr:unnamed protein product [Rodentolepis nana]